MPEHLWIAAEWVVSQPHMDEAWKSDMLRRLGEQLPQEA